MIIIRKITIILLAIAILFIHTGSSNVWAASEPDIKGQTAVLIDVKSGRVLYEKDAHIQWAPASTTKVLSVLLALEKANLNDIVTVSENAVDVDGTVIWLREGEKQTLENLLYVMMLHSANDAAVAVAQHIGGTVEGFAKLMNERVKTLGLKDTHFSTPNGLTADDHYSTAYDMAMIAREAMKNAKFREISATKSRPWRGTDWNGNLTNFNSLLSIYPGATGIKNGYTSVSDWNLAASAERDGENYIAVVFGSPTKQSLWEDAEKLLDYGFDNFSNVSLVTEGEQIADLSVGSAEHSETVKITTQADFSYLIGGEDAELPQRKLVLEKTAAPIEKDENLGYVAFILGEEEIGRVAVTADKAVSEPTTWLDWWVRFTWVMAGLLVLRILIRFFQKRKKRRSFYNNYSRRGRSYGR